MSSPIDTKCSHCGKPAKFFYENVNKCSDCSGQKAKKKMAYAVMVDEYEQQIAQEMRDIAVTKKLKKKNCINCGRVFKPNEYNELVKRGVIKSDYLINTDKIKDTIEVNIIDSLNAAFSAGFFASHCSHNGEMIDEKDLEGITKERYTYDMFNAWLKKSLEDHLEKEEKKLNE